MLIATFFQVNGSTPYKILLRETIKEFISVVPFSQEIYLTRKKSELLDGLMRKVEQLEDMHKHTLCPEVKQRMLSEVAKIKLIEASQTAPDTLYAKRNTFKYRDKLNAH